MDPNNHDSAEKYADILKIFRKRAGLTQVELAEKSGISQSIISRTENATSSPGIDAYADMLSACGVDLFLLLERVAAAQDSGREIEHWEPVSAAMAQVLDELGPAIEKEKAILIAMDHYGAFAGTTDPAKARKKIIETWWGLRQASGRD